MGFRCEKTGANVQRADGVVMHGDSYADSNGALVFRGEATEDTHFRDRLDYHFDTWDLSWRLESGLGVYILSRGQYRRTDRLMSYLQPETEGTET